MARFVPPAALHVADKLSTAVAYIYTSPRGLPAAIVYRGRSEKADWWLSFTSEAAREKRVRAFFLAQQAAERRTRERRAERAAFRHSYKPGDLFRASWGYDQTNIDYYEVTELRGETMLMVRKISQAREATGWEQGKCVPLPGEYVGEPIRVRAQQNFIRVGHQHAFFVEPTIVGGVKTYGASHWTSYA